MKKFSFFCVVLAFALFFSTAFSACSLNGAAFDTGILDSAESSRTDMPFESCSDSSLPQENDSSTTETDVDELLSGRIPYSAAYDGYEAPSAEYEAEDLALWFNHAYTRTAEEETKHGEKITYRMTLARNETESCQLLLSSKTNREGLFAELTDFRNASGRVLRADLFEGYYFEVQGRKIIDPLPPVRGAFSLAQGRSKTLLIKVYADAESEPGEYEALVRIKDSEGREIKKASLFAYVWNFVLPEETSCKTLTDLSWYNIYSYHRRSFRNLSKNPQWRKKAYFYPLDEPSNVEELEKIRVFAKLIKKYYSEEYKLIAPMHINAALDETCRTDFFNYVEDSVTVWCPHTYFFNTYAEYLENPELTYWMTEKLEEELGTFVERMDKKKSEGDEVWWYVTHTPAYPEITLTTESAAINYRILFWQQKLYDVNGFLYYSTNDWFGNGEDFGWNAKHETWNGTCDSYGNGVLIYCGAYMGIDGPVGSLRLECVRDGIEDFEYLSLLEKWCGKETLKKIVEKLTTSLGCYESNEEYFNELRESLGVLVEDVSDSAFN